MYIFFPKQHTHPNHTSREVWARGAKSRGPFFLPYRTKPEASNSTLKAQGELSPVVHGKRKAQVNGIGPPIKMMQTKELDMLIIHLGMELNLHKTLCHFQVVQLQDLEPNVSRKH
jgi:hypothetical protein